MQLKKILWEILFILLLSCILGFSVNFSLIKRFVKGEFDQSFISAKKYPHISFIALAEAEDLFISQKALFIDSRREEAYASGYILGALNIPYEDGEEELRLEHFDLTPDKTLVVYCDGSECQSSIHLAKFLHERGYKDIRVFFGGWQEWVEAGLPVEEKND